MCINKFKAIIFMVPLFKTIIFMAPLFLLSCSYIHVTNEPYKETLTTAYMLLANNDEIQAKKYLYSSLEKNPENVYLHTFYQDNLLKDKDNEYLVILNKIQDKKLLSYIKIRQNKEIDAKKLQLQELEKNYSHPALYFDLAQIYYAQKEFDDALLHIDKAISLKRDWANAYESRAFILLGLLKWSDALVSARIALQIDPQKIKPHFFEAANYLLYGQYLSAIKVIKNVRLLHPNYNFNADEQVGLLTSYWRELLAAKEGILPVSGLTMANEALDDFPDQSVFLALKGEFAFELEIDNIAEEALKKALQLNPYSMRTVKTYRRLLFQKKKYRQAYQIWERIIPVKLVFDEKNNLLHRYQRLKKSIYNANDNDSQSLLELARSLARVGWEEEALIIYKQVEGETARQEQKTLTNHLAFLHAMREYVIKYYQTTKYDIVSMLKGIKNIAEKYEIYLDTIPSKEFESYFFVIREVDPFDINKGTLGDYLASYNKFFDMGNNYGQIEFRLMNRLCYRNYNRMIWGKPRSYYAIVCDETYIDSFSGYYSGAPTIAGRAFLSNKGFYISIDALRPGINKLQDLYNRIINPEPLPAKFDIEKKTFLPYQKGIADLFLSLDLAETVKVLPSDEEQKWDSFYQVILERNIDTVHNHELGHINDFPCFLPVYSHMKNHWQMLWKNSFSPEKIQTRFEHVAELFGMAHTQYLYYYLFQEMERLDADFEGIFTMVYWAWYGRLPSGDPYYKSASQIYLHLMQLTGKKDWATLQQLPQLSENKLREYIYQICHEEDIDKRCDCP